MNDQGEAVMFAPISSKAIVDVVLFRHGKQQLELLDEDGEYWEVRISDGKLITVKSPYQEPKKSQSS